MAIVTIGRLSEEIKKILDGGDTPLASSISYNEIKISIGQVCNSLLKLDYLQTNVKMREPIPNGGALGLYEGVAVTKKGMVSEAVLPITPLKLPRGMGVWSVWQTDKPETEFIPLQMGQSNLLKSQPLINNLLGQVGYERFGNRVVFTKDLTVPQETITVDMRLAIMDISQYGDYDILPILPEMEWQIKQEVLNMYSKEPIPDKLVDSSVKESKNIPLKQQTQS